MDREVQNIVDEIRHRFTIAQFKKKLMEELARGPLVMTPWVVGAPMLPESKDVGEADEQPQA